MASSAGPEGPASGADRCSCQLPSQTDLCFVLCPRMLLGPPLAPTPSYWKATASHAFLTLTATVCVHEGVRMGVHR